MLVVLGRFDRTVFFVPKGEIPMAWDLDEAIAYYRRQGAPGDQSAVLSLLREIQQEQGSISYEALAQLEESYGVKQSYYLALIKRIPSLRLADKHTLQMCAGPNCGKAAHLADTARKLCGDKVTLKFVPCMRLCGKGPNLRFDGKPYHRADKALLEQLLNQK